MEQQLKQELELLHSQVCQALNDPTRLMILYTLGSGPRYVKDIALELSLPQPTISRHLQVLRERGLIDSTRHGTSVQYSLPDERMIEILDLLRSVLRDRVLRQATLIADPKPESASTA